jgi:hypothetical protein
MGRGRTVRINQVKERLKRRLTEGHYRAGERFLSNRALAERYELSYQTADRLIREFCAEGLLERRPCSGTYVPGVPEHREGAELCFDERARESGSFGSRLLEELRLSLAQRSVPCRVVWNPAELDPKWFPVAWERPMPIGTRCLILDRRPEHGLESLHQDSVCIDDFGGGACAAQIVLVTLGRMGPYVVFGGPANDPRCGERARGFLSVLSSVVIPCGLSREDAFLAAPQVLACHPAAVFCASDRLADGLLAYCRETGGQTPKVVGFDDDPIAESLDLTTIAIPWSDVVRAASDIIARRMDDSAGSCIHLTVTPRPILRGSCG